MPLWKGWQRESKGAAIERWGNQFVGREKKHLQGVKTWRRYWAQARGFWHLWWKCMRHRGNPTVTRLNQSKWWTVRRVGKKELMWWRSDQFVRVTEWRMMMAAVAQSNTQGRVCKQIYGREDRMNNLWVTQLVNNGNVKICEAGLKYVLKSSSERHLWSERRCDIKSWNYQQRRKHYDYGANAHTHVTLDSSLTRFNRVTRSSFFTC